MHFNTAIYFFCSTHSKKYMPLWVKDFLCAKETNLKSKCGIALFVNKINTCKRSKIQWAKKGEKHFGDNERRKWRGILVGTFYRRAGQLDGTHGDAVLPQSTQLTEPRWHKRRDPLGFILDTLTLRIKCVSFLLWY